MSRAATPKIPMSVTRSLVSVRRRCPARSSGAPRALPLITTAEGLHQRAPDVLNDGINALPFVRFRFLARGVVAACQLVVVGAELSEFCQPLHQNCVIGDGTASCARSWGPVERRTHESAVAQASRRRIGQ